MHVQHPFAGKFSVLLAKFSIKWPYIILRALAIIICPTFCFINFMLFNPGYICVRTSGLGYAVHSYSHTPVCKHFLVTCLRLFSVDAANYKHLAMLSYLTVPQTANNSPFDVIFLCATLGNLLVPEL